MDPTAGVMPEAVSNRMLSRVVPFASVGVVGAMLVFAAFYFLRTQLDLDVPPMVVAYASGAMLLLSFAGITYGVMSTSLDEDADQSLLGTENLQRNLNIMRGVEAERIPLQTRKTSSSSRPSVTAFSCHRQQRRGASNSSSSSSSSSKSSSVPPPVVGLHAERHDG